MRSFIRGLCISAALISGAMLPSACQQQTSAPADAPAAPSDAEREAEIAAEQLAALGGPANAAQRALYEGEFQASGGIDELGLGEGGGAEGAWELRLLNDYAQFSRPGLGEDGGLPGDRDYRERGMRVVAGAVTITIMQRPCTASGLQLDYVAHVLYEGVSYQGCARRGVSEGERASWASVLPDLIPAIDTCLARATSRPARVTFAAALGGGDTSVRIREANGARHECIAAGGQVTVFETLSDVDRRGTEGDPDFQRGGARPGGACVEPAVSRGGEQLGWLIRRNC